MLALYDHVAGPDLDIPFASVTNDPSFESTLRAGCVFPLFHQLNLFFSFLPAVLFFKYPRLECRLVCITDIHLILTKDRPPVLDSHLFPPLYPSTTHCYVIVSRHFLLFLLPFSQLEVASILLEFVGR